MRMRRQESGDEGVQSGGGAHFVRGAAAKSTKSSDFSWTDRGISFNLSRQLHHVIFSMVRREQASDGLSHLLRLPLSPSLEAILSQQDGSRWRAASNLSLMLTSLPSFLLLRDLRGPRHLVPTLLSRCLSRVRVCLSTPPPSLRKLGKNVSPECHLATLPPFFSSDGTRRKEQSFAKSYVL